MVISLTGTVGKSDYGNICILDNSYEEYYLNQRNAKLEILEKLDKYYLSKVLKFDSIKSKLTNISRGVRQANISNKDIENLQIPIPPLSLQQEFAKRIELIEQQKAQISSTIKDLETLLASRMQYWFD
jgi:type I restriction enzyme S subunit